MAEHSIKDTLETVSEYIGEEIADALEEKENIFRYSTMPIASSENEDDIIQYIGATTQDYTNGYFYKCVAQGTDPETYAWEAQPVQEGGSGGHTIEDSTGADMTARANLQFVGATVTDDSTNDRTVVTISGGGGGEEATSADVQDVKGIIDGISNISFDCAAKQSDVNAIKSIIDGIHNIKYYK